MIAGIAKVGAGVVALEEFREGSDPAAAVAAFCAEYSPPLAEAAYLGIDTGWPAVQSAADGYVWAWDFDLSALVQKAAPSPEYRLSVEVVSITPQVVTASTWTPIGGVVLTPSVHGDLASIAAAMTGEALVSGSAELRVTETDAAGVVVDMTPTPLPLADTAGAYITWALTTTVPPRDGRHTYRVEARVVASGDSASMRFASMALAVDE
jgi:hypothetical protein